MNRFSVARTTEEYIDAISIPSTWMSFTDLFFLAKCFDLRITLLELKDNGDRFLKYDNIRISRYGSSSGKNVVIRY